MPKPLAVVPDLEAELDALYALPPADFTEARNDLARRLKQAGRDEASSEVKGLRKPTVPVWAVNQLARQHASEVQALLDASEQLRSSQRTALGGGETDELRRATTAQRDALQALTQHGHEVLAASGQSSTSSVLERIASTLRAAAVDPDLRSVLERGRLNEELDPAGFDAFAGMPVPARSRKAATASKPKPSANVKRREERVRKLREALDEAEAAAGEAEQQAERAGKEADRARVQADRARVQLEAAEQELEAAKRER